MGAAQQVILMKGSAITLDHHETLTYVGNATYPRALSATVDAQNGIVWGKDRDTGGTGFKPIMIYPADLVGATRYQPTSDTTSAAANSTVTIAASSVTLGSNAAPASSLNTNTKNFVMWLMKRKVGFLDVIPYAGNSTNRAIAHNLGVAPGFIMVMNRGAPDNIIVGHRSMTDWTRSFVFDSGAAQAVTATAWNSTAPDASNFYVGNGSAFLTNRTGNDYTALLWAHDTGASGLCQCDSYTGNGSATGPTISLGWDPRWVMIKNRGASGGWHILDSARSSGFSGNDWFLNGDEDGADNNSINVLSLTGSGFQIATNNGAFNTNGSTYLYVAIR